MAFTTAENEALARLPQYNKNTYDETTNPYGMGGAGYKDNIPGGNNDVGVVGGAVAREAQAAVDSAAAAATSETNALNSENNAAGHEAQALIYRDQAAASAASTQFPVANSAGSGSAYTVDFDPDLTITDGAAFRLNLHATNANSPTLAVDGGAAKEMVRDDGTAINAGEMPAGYTAIVYYESTIDKFVVVGLLRTVWYQDINANGNQLNNLRGYSNKEGIRVDGTLTDRTLKKCWYAVTTQRLHAIKPFLKAGTIDIKLSHNGSDFIGFGAGPSDTVSVTTTPTESDVNEDSNAYLDLAVGDFIEVTLSNASGAKDLIMPFDTTENYTP